MLIYVLALKGINHEFFLLKFAGHLTGFFFPYRPNDLFWRTQYSIFRSSL